MSAESDDMVDFEAEEKKAETDKAWLLVIDGVEVWLPKSRCEFDESDMSVYIPRWLAEEKNLT